MTKTSGIALGLIGTLLVASAPVMAQAASGSAGASAINPNDARSVHGAVYVPAYAWNAYQMWDQYGRNKAYINHDLKLAAVTKLNILRVWLSYEDWKQDPAGYGMKLDDFAAKAQANGLSLLVSIFENDGVVVQNGDDFVAVANRSAVDGPDAGYCIASPGRLADYDAANPTAEHKRNAQAWDNGASSPGGFVRWFMTRYARNSTFYAVESMNEPGAFHRPTQRFAVEMFKLAHDLRDSMNSGMRVTIGSADAGSLEAMLNGTNTGLGRTYAPDADLVTIHNNFPTVRADITDEAREANDYAAGSPRRDLNGNVPQVWLTEWQRQRRAMPQGGYADTDKIPNYASLADEVNAANVGSFFWSLMVKAAYLPNFRKSSGAVNGLFWPKISETNNQPVITSRKDFEALTGISTPTNWQEYQVPGNFSETEGHDYQAPKTP